MVATATYVFAFLSVRASFVLTMCNLWRIVKARDDPRPMREALAGVLVYAALAAAAAWLSVVVVGELSLGQLLSAR